MYFQFIAIRVLYIVFVRQYYYFLLVWLQLLWKEFHRLYKKRMKEY